MTENNLSVRQAAERLHVSGETVRDWIRDGRLVGAFQKTPGKRTSAFLIPESAIIALEEQRVVVRSNTTSDQVGQSQ